MIQIRWSQACATVFGLALATTAAGENGSLGDGMQRLDALVITAPMMDTPLRTETDPRRPRSGLPANDGGAYLASVPGMATSRKGGTSGDPLLRGLGGSRLNILLDDTEILGGCGGRMDPPTAYVFPQAYDRIEITKGPQSVRHGASQAGVVRFERDRPRVREPTVEGFAGMTAGSYGRLDLMTDVTAGSSEGYSRLIGTLSTQEDYADGGGNTVHSAYERWSATGIAGWTPGDDTHVAFTWDRSDGEAAYDDRGMDGTRFDRTGYRLEASQENLTDWLAEIQWVGYYNHVDHVMDNFRLRTPPNMPMVSFPERRTVGSRLNASVVPWTGGWLDVGVDGSENQHAGGSLMGPDALAWRQAAREDTARFEDVGLFAELEQETGARGLVAMGLRIDRSEAEAERDGYGGVEAGERERDTLTSGFLRYEHAFDGLPLTAFSGIGHAERAPDFWERERVFDLAPEALTQVDLGLAWRGRRASGSLALFHARIDDYILIVDGDTVAAHPDLDAEARNIEAETSGVEADVEIALGHHLSVQGSLAYTRGRNTTDGTPLAQMPPLEGTLGLEYSGPRYTGGVLIRGVARQHRIDAGSGTIYSLDTDETPGFATVGAHAGVRLSADTQLTIGADNLFDREYAEHIQRGSADLGASDARINEPGRRLWVNVTTEF